MKSCLGLIIALIVFVAVIGGGALIWYLSSTAEFSRGKAVDPPTAIPTAVPVHPQISPHQRPPVR